MSVFRDKQGREFRCRVSAATAITLKKELSINLLDHFDGSLWQRLATDPELLVNVLFEITRESREEFGIVDGGAFARLLDGDVLEAAGEAMRAAIVDFIPPRQRAAFRKLLEKSKAVELVTIEKMEAAVDGMTIEGLTAAIEMMHEKGQATSNRSSGNSSDSPAADSTA